MKGGLSSNCSDFYFSTIFCALFCSMFLIHLFFYGGLVLRYPDVEVNPGPPMGARTRKCRILYSNINGLYGNLAELGVVAKGFDIVACAETKVTQRRHSCELRLPGFSSPLQLLRGSRRDGLGLALYVRSGLSVSRQSRFECACCEFMILKVCGVRQNFYIFFVYRSPNADDRMFDCLLDAMGRIQSVDRRSVFCYVGDFNCHHTEWLGSPRTDGHGVAAYDFATVADCTQLVRGPTHRAGGTLDLIMTNVPDLCRVVVGGPIGRSDHSHIALHLDTSARTPGFEICKEVLLKSRVDWNIVRRRVSDLSWGAIFLSAEMVDLMDRELLAVVDACVPKVRIKRQSRDEPWFDEECRNAFMQKQAAYFVWQGNRNLANWELFKNRQRQANSCYARARSRFTDRCKARLASATSESAWWSSLKECIFYKDSSIPPLQGDGGAMVSDPAAKAELLSVHFDSKQSRDVVNLPATCHPQPKLCGFAFRSREVLRLLSELDPQGGPDPLGFFPLFFKECAGILAPKLSRVFRQLLRQGSFPQQWRCANVVPIPKGPVSSLVTGFRPISITPVLSKVYERLVSSRLSVFMEREGIFPRHQYAYRKNLGTCDALLDLVGVGHAALDAGSELALVQIDFSAAFDKVNHAGLVHKLQTVGVGGWVLDVIVSFLTNRVQRVVVDGKHSRVVNVVSGVPQGSVLGPLLFLLYTSDLPITLENTLIGYADDSTLLAVVRKPTDRASVVASLNRDLERVGKWCTLWGMVINPSKTKALVVSRSRTAVPGFPDLLLGGVVVDLVDDLKILGVTIDKKFSFEKHLRSVAASAASKLGIMRKALRLFNDQSLVARCFWSFLLPVLEYCSQVWMSAAECHLRLLDRVVRKAIALSGGVFTCNLGHRRKVAALCLFYKIRSNASHPVHDLLPGLFVPRRATRLAESAHDFRLEVPRLRTSLCSRSFVPACVQLWNSLDRSVFANEGVDVFKSRVNRALLSG